MADHDPATLAALHAALLDTVVAMNRPQQDQALLDAARLRLDRALFPLLVQIGRAGPIGVVDLADRVGRDHSTVSRQVAKLESEGLVERRPHPQDRRVRALALTPAGRRASRRIDVARARLGRQALAGFSAADVETLGGLLRRFADALAPFSRERDG